jgi:Ca-activated chloride channel family protein
VGLLAGCGQQSAPQSGRAEYFSTGSQLAVDESRAAGNEAEFAAPMPEAAGEDGQFNTEAYDQITENNFLDVMSHPQSTFSIDVDTASYSNVRRFLMDDRLPTPGAVRIEELVNYFDYTYPQPDSAHPFSVSIDAAGCPWNEDHQLVRIALSGKKIEADRRPPCNLVFLLDVSGSMHAYNKLPLVKSAMQMLVRQLNGDDRVAMVVYAGASGLVLPSVSAGEQSRILAALDGLQAGGSTNGGEGISLAYRIAKENFIDNGINRVILCTDGDFNVGVTSQDSLIDLITDSAKSGVFLSVFGFGTGNLKDSTMEKLADKGNGNYGYIDSILEARRLLVDQVGATLVTIAKDVKIQVDFNPAQVAAYRLIGYENRMLRTEDFDDDSKDAGEIGAGHCVTALYEIVPAGADSPARPASSSRFVESVPAADADPETMLVVDLRYKQPDEEVSQKFTCELKRPEIVSFERADDDFRFASAVAGFGMLLRQSEFAGSLDWDWVVATGSGGLAGDAAGLRGEFVQLARRAQALAESRQPVSR